MVLVTRRQLITLLGGAAAAWPLAARAQQPAMPVVGLLRDTSLSDSARLVTALRRGLKESGFIEGQNVAIELRFAGNRPDRLPGLVAELIRRSVAVIVGNVAAAFAAKAATTTVPIVFTTGGDPVRDGLVASLNRPGGNVTGVSFLAGTVGAKRLELLCQLVPRATTIGMLVYPNNPVAEADRRDVEAAALAIGQQLIVLEVDSPRDIEAAVATLVQRGVGALQFSAGSFMFAHREKLVALASRHALPASYANPDAVQAGGLMSYGPSLTDACRQAGIYVGRILKGEKPADLPVVQSTKFELVINLRTARALGLEIPDKLLALADEVIE